MLRQLLRTGLGPYKRQLVVLLALQAVQTTAALVLPELNAQIIDRGVLKGDSSYIRSTGAVMLGFSVLQITFAAAAMYVGAKLAMSFGRDVRHRLFHQVTEFSSREVGTFGAPSLITRITNDVLQVQMLVVMICTMALGAPITATVGIAMAVREDVGLSVVLAVAIPVAAVVLGTIVSQMMPAFGVMQERIDVINRFLREQITGIRVVRAFVREPEERVRFRGANEDVTSVALKAGRLMSAMFPTVNLLINVTSVGVLWLGADRVASGDVQVGSVVAYLSYVVQVLMSVMMATWMVGMIPRASVSAGRIGEVLATQPTVARAVDGVREVSVRGHVELRGAGFHHPGAEHAVLQDITFSTGPGQTTAIIGSTGSGKTTLVNLIPRLFDATSGAVLVDGVDVRQLDTDLLASLIGVVPQRAYLFSGTIASNLRVGKDDATEEEMWAALEVAQAKDFVQAMGGLDARIEQGGTNLSGGQRQRMSIARALVRRPEIYVFDDSFSALDLQTDARLRAALGPWTREAAVVIVAQRVSTIAQADEIIVLEDGVVVGQGDHQQLLESCPTYAEIVQSQIGEREAAA
jgi:ATP-binding cassette subfamily B multidrug efflux pump